MNISFSTKDVLKVGAGPVLIGIAALIIRGTVVAQGNFVCDIGVNPNCGIVSGVRSDHIPLYAANTATGSKATYDTLLAPSPFRSAVAASQGHRAGTGVIHPGLQLHIISNPTGAKITCSKTGSPNSATGGTLYFKRVSATGAIVLWDSGSIVLGPTENIKCGTLDTVAPGLSFELRGDMNDSSVVN